MEIQVYKIIIMYILICLLRVVQMVNQILFLQAVLPHRKTSETQPIPKRQKTECLVSGSALHHGFFAASAAVTRAFSTHGNAPDTRRFAAGALIVWFLLLQALFWPLWIFTIYTPSSTPRRDGGLSPFKKIFQSIYKPYTTNQHMSRHLYVLQFMILVTHTNAQFWPCNCCALGRFNPTGNTCVQCNPGYFCPTRTVNQRDCTSGTWSGLGQSSCSACASNSGVSCFRCTSAASCQCNPGYTGPNGGPCTACNPGSYKLASGTSACIFCGNGKFSTTGAATAETTCQACPVNSGFQCIGCSALNFCTCNRGYTGPDGGPCTACVPGKYKDITGSQLCFDCFPGTYTTSIGASSSGLCQFCPTNSNSPSGSSILAACTCNTGFTGPHGGPCTSCAAGTYKDVSGSVACINCGPGRYSTAVGATAVSTCLACPANSGYSCIGCNALANCTCNLGFTGPNGNNCTACTVGTYKDTTGSNTCTSCPANSGSECNACYTSICPCNSGYTGGNFISPHSLTACVRFIALTPKPSFASVSTRNNMAIGSVTLPTYNATGGPSGKGHARFDRTLSQYIDSGPRTLNVLTNGGLTIVVLVRFGTLVADERIFEMWSAGGLEFSLGRLSTTTTMTFFGFNAGVSSFSRNGPANSVSTEWTYVICNVVSRTSRASIRVNLGSTGLTANVNLAVQDKSITNIYIGRALSPDRYFNGDIAGLFVVDELLTTEAANEIYNNMLNGVDLTDTTCPSGNPCTACATGTYKNNTGTSQCTVCPAGLTSPTASTSSAACLSAACNAGYTGPDGGPCTACVAGKYKTTTGSVGCTNCFSGTYSATAGAVSAGLCMVCPTSSNSPTGSSALAACTCNVGFTGPNGGPCTECGAGTYKDASGSAACTACSVNTFSQTVKATSAATCLACPANANSPAGSTAATSCTCNVGFAFSNNVCVCALGYQPGA